MSMFTRRTVPAEWSLERIYSLVDSVYVASDHVPMVAAVVIRMPSSVMPRKVLRAQIEIHAEPWIEHHWWGFSWHEYDVEEACLDDPIHCIRARGAQRAMADTRNAARAWVARDRRPGMAPGRSPLERRVSWHPVDLGCSNRAELVDPQRHGERLSCWGMCAQCCPRRRIPTDPRASRAREAGCR
jgi:hypothetical protein